jgi:hypothetical protein
MELWTSDLVIGLHRPGKSHNYALSDWIKITVAGQYYEESRDVSKLKNLEGKVQREQVYIGQFNLDASKKLGMHEPNSSMGRIHPKQSDQHRLEIPRIGS